MPLKVVIEDSAGRAQTALDAAKKLVSVDGAELVVGEYSSGITVPLRQALQREGIVHVNCGSSSVKLRVGGGRTSFSVIGLDDLMAKFAAAALRKQNLGKAAVIVPNNAYGESITAEFGNAFKAAGGQVVNSTLYTEGQSTYRRELQQIARYAPDVYLYSAYGQEAAIINREAFELGQKKTPWFGVYLSMCVSDAPKETVEGQIGRGQLHRPQQQMVPDNYTAKYKEKFRRRSTAISTTPWPWRRRPSTRPAARTPPRSWRPPARSTTTGPPARSGSTQTTSAPWRTICSRP